MTDNALLKAVEQSPNIDTPAEGDPQSARSEAIELANQLFSEDGVQTEEAVVETQQTTEQAVEEENKPSAPTTLEELAKLENEKRLSKNAPKEEEQEQKVVAQINKLAEVNGDPDKFFELMDEAGINIDQVVEQIVAKPEKEKNKELSTLQEQVAEMRAQSEKQQEVANEQAVEDYKQTVFQEVTAEDYPLVSATDNKELVFNVIRNYSIETGEVLDTKTAASIVENELSTHYKNNEPSARALIKQLTAMFPEAQKKEIEEVVQDNTGAVVQQHAITSDHQSTPAPRTEGYSLNENERRIQILKDAADEATRQFSE